MYLIGKLTMSNVILQNNYKKDGNGGGIYIHTEATNPIVEINDTTFQSNEANFGGGIFIGSKTCETKLENVKVFNNKSLTKSGGGIYAYGNITILGENTEISNNIAKTYGGGMITKNQCTLSSGIISNNVAEKNAGGGIRVDGKITITGGEITGNLAGTTGGGIDYTEGIIYCDNFSIIHDNTASNEGNDLYPPYENCVDWTQDESLKLKKTNVELFKSFKRGIDIDNRATQGMAVTDKYIVFVLWKTNEDETMIAISDKKTGEILNIIDDYCFKHANDMTWDSKRNEIYVLTSSNKIAKFKIDNSNNITDLTYVDCARAYTTIAYLSDIDGFAGKSGKKIYIMDNELHEKNEPLNTPTNLTSQGMGYHKGIIYLCCTEFGTINNYQTIFNNKEKLSNLIYKYDLNGTLVETLYIPNTILAGEIESCAFENDDTLIMSYNVKIDEQNTVSFYKSDVIPPRISKVTDGQIYEEAVKPEIVDKNLKTVVLRKNEENVVNYTVGDSIEEPGNYTLSAEDKMGNKTEMSFTIKEPDPPAFILGDVNNDKIISPTDIMMIKRHIVEIKILTDDELIRGDTNKDNKITGTDLINVKRLSVDL